MRTKSLVLIAIYALSSCKGELPTPQATMLLTADVEAAPGPPPETDGDTPILAASIPPYSYEENGATKGVLAELVHEMAGRVGQQGKITFLPWVRAQRAVAMHPTGGSVLLLPLTRTPERETQYRWIAELLSDDAVLVSKRSVGIEPLTIDSVKDQPVGALLGSPLALRLSELGCTQVDPAYDEESNARKLRAGRIAAWLVARRVAPFVAYRVDLNPEDLHFGAVLRVNHLYLAGSLSMSDEEVERWRAALAAMKQDGTYERILALYPAPL